MSRNRTVALLMLFLSLGAFSTADAGQYPYSKAKIYYLQWFYVTDKMPSPQFVRDEAAIVVSVSDKTETDWLMEDLHLEKMKSWDGKGSQYPLSLVIDFLGADGKNYSYYADGCYLYSADYSKRVPIDSTLRTRFGYTDLDKEVESVFKKKISEMCE